METQMNFHMPTYHIFNIRNVMLVYDNGYDNSMN